METIKTKPDEPRLNQNGADKSKTYEVVTESSVSIPLSVVYARCADLLDGIPGESTVRGKKEEGEPVLSVQVRKVTAVKGA